MSETEEIDILLAGVEDAHTIAELQSYVIAANEYFEVAFDEPEIRFAADANQDRRVRVLETWLSAIEGRMNEIVDGGNFETYSITVGGSLTGPSVSISVTARPNPDANGEE